MKSRAPGAAKLSSSAARSMADGFASAVSVANINCVVNSSTTNQFLTVADIILNTLSKASADASDAEAAAMMMQGLGAVSVCSCLCYSCMYRFA